MPASVLSGGTSARTPSFQHLGKGRKGASDGPAWTAAILEAIEQFLAAYQTVTLARPRPDPGPTPTPTPTRAADPGPGSASAQGGSFRDLTPLTVGAIL